MTSSDMWSDGTALAGPSMRSCGSRSAPPSGLHRLWAHRADGRGAGVRPRPGVVARYPACDQVLLRLVRGPGRAWLDLCGLTYLQLAVPDAT